MRKRVFVTSTELKTVGVRHCRFVCFPFTHWITAWLKQQHQVLGKIRTREGRLLTFPNVLQHRVSPFTFADPSKPGHRKLLALFLVDPYICIPSTANVPPQQAECWARNGDIDFILERFPNEIADQVIEGVDGVDFPISSDKAYRIREQLIEERKGFVDGVAETSKESGYCFCEH